MKFFKNPRNLVILAVILLASYTLIKPQIPLILDTWDILSGRGIIVNNYCMPPENYKKLLKEAFGNNLDIKNVIEEKQPFIKWKRTSNEPYISYPAKSEVVLIVNNKGRDIYKAYKISVDNKLRSIGFVADELNTQGYRYGYKYGNTIDVVSFSDGYVYFDCGLVDSEYNALYDDLLSSEAARGELRSTYGENLKDASFSIWRIHRNNIIMTNIRDHAAWFYKENDIWKIIYRGQDNPACSLLEKLNIEPGVDCNDTSSGYLILSKTK